MHAEFVTRSGKKKYESERRFGLTFRFLNVLFILVQMVFVQLRIDARLRWR